MSKNTDIPHPRGSIAMCVLIKDLRRSGVHVYANKELARYFVGNSRVYLVRV
jgi:hypothetical protein